MDNGIYGHGGARRGAGAKPRGSEESAVMERFNDARARNEMAKAQMNELELSIKLGAHLPRDPIKMAASIAVASIVQALRSLPDNLEREFSLEPEIVENIAQRIDEALADLGQQFKKMAGE